MKRQRGRNNNNNRRNNNHNNNNNVNPNRSMDSNGPDVKVRGSASTIFEKYTTMARDAKTSGNRVKAENYLQHAEHYLRVMNELNAKLEAQRLEREAAKEAARLEREARGESEHKSDDDDNNSRRRNPRRHRNQDDNREETKPEEAVTESKDEKPKAKTKRVKTSDDEKPAKKKKVAEGLEVVTPGEDAPSPRRRKAPSRKAKPEAEPAE